MPEPILLPAAHSGLINIYLYLAQDDINVADRFARDFDRRFQLLAERP